MRRSSSAADRYRAAQRKKVIVLVALVTLLAVVWVITGLGGGPSPAIGQPPTNAAPAPTDVTPAIAAIKPEPRVEVRIQWPVQLVRDPFALDREPEPDQPIKPRLDMQQFTLQGTIIGDHPRALINGKAVPLGGTINGAVVKQIEHGLVVLEFDGTQIRLRD